MDRTRIRSEALFGKGATELLKSKTVAVLGLGGVGCSACEALCRSGIGRLILVDSDKFEKSNLNRQLFATRSSIGKWKTEVARDRIKEIDEETEVVCYNELFLPDNSSFLFENKIDFVVDAIDNITAKIFLIKSCKEKGIPIVSCFGTGSRVKPELLCLGKLSDTSGSGCAIAKIMRKELRKLGITDLDVVFSKEEAIKPKLDIKELGEGRFIPSSPFVPNSAGLILASFVVRSLIIRLNFLSN